MKKVLAILAASIIITLAASAQELFDFGNPSIPEVADAMYDHPTSGHSISVSIIGLEYSYECPVGRYWTVIFSGGFPYCMTGYERQANTTTINDGSTTISQYNYSAQYSFNPRPGITVEPRLYTSMGRRSLRGRNTRNNSSDFISVKIKVYTVDFDDVYCSVIPAYGIRRGGEHWFREYTFGLGLHSMGDILPHFNIRVGYSF
jgi:hypothetical protein